MPSEHVRRDAEWIYKTLADAFTKETGKAWESYSRIQLKPIEGATNEELKWKSGLLEVDCIEFEVDAAAPPDSATVPAPQVHTTNCVLGYGHEGQCAPVVPPRSFQSGDCFTTEGKIVRPFVDLVPERTCVKCRLCKHEGRMDNNGVCRVNIRDTDANDYVSCGCRCEFASTVPDADVERTFIEAGWAYSHSISNGELCSDRSCYRCRLAALLFETERRATPHPVAPQGEQKSKMIKRADPANCGCTDCLVGEYSKPFNRLDDKELDWLREGLIDDATGEHQ